MGFRRIVAGLFGMGEPRKQAAEAGTVGIFGTKGALKHIHHGPGLHPRDARGQYVSPKATSKRNRHK